MPIKISNVFLNEQDCSGVHLALFFLRISGNSENRTPDIHTRRVSSDIGNAASSTAF